MSDDRPDLVRVDLATGTRTWLTDSPSRAINARVSPDAGFVAYASHESGQREVYASAMAGGPPRQISIGGGDAPKWRRDTRELVYLRPDGTFMAVSVPSAAGGEFGAPQELFRAEVERAIAESPRFDMSPDGQRFLIEVQGSHIEPLVLVQNWTALLKPQATTR